MVGESQEQLVGAGAGGGAGSNKTPTLEEYGTNLTTQANEVRDTNSHLISYLSTLPPADKGSRLFKCVGITASAVLAYACLLSSECSGVLLCRARSSQECNHVKHCTQAMKCCCVGQEAVKNSILRSIAHKAVGKLLHIVASCLHCSLHWHMVLFCFAPCLACWI